jgi:spermidine synthase
VDFDESVVKNHRNAILDRDYIASVVSFGETRAAKSLLVNGFGMTTLTPITKFISHLPLALHRGEPHSVLVICFGMGTSYRSALTWNIDTTAVELVPSVPKMFSFFHADAEKYANHPRGRIIIDDGRRYLSRCGKSFDVIVVDPPPPVEAAGSSLLFSTEFYALAKQHLNPGGIVQMWYPGADKTTDGAVARSMAQSFPFVRCFVSVEGWGVHLLGSMEPFETPPRDQLLARLPAAAKADLVEWTPSVSAEELMTNVLRHEIGVDQLLNSDVNIQITDDRPMNEYYLLRQLEKRNK